MTAFSLPHEVLDEEKQTQHYRDRLVANDYYNVFVHGKSNQMYRRFGEYIYAVFMIAEKNFHVHGTSQLLALTGITNDITYTKHFNFKFKPIQSSINPKYRKFIEAFGAETTWEAFNAKSTLVWPGHDYNKSSHNIKLMATSSSNYFYFMYKDIEIKADQDIDSSPGHPLTNIWTQSFGPSEPYPHQIIGFYNSYDKSRLHDGYLRPKHRIFLLARKSGERIKVYNITQSKVEFVSFRSNLHSIKCLNNYYILNI